jgi:membrane-bound serine protease (ClpP class)
VKFLLAVALIALGTLLAVAEPTAPRTPAAAAMTIDGAIGPGTVRQVSQGLQQAVREGASVVVMQMDTPGGLDTSMREIVRAILASPLPVLTYVGPSGARAASAGTFILYASHVAAMAPGTNLGAATPVPLGGGASQPNRGSRGTDPDADAGEGQAGSKAVNDAVAYMRSLAELRGRNADWGEQAVREAASLPAQAALAQGVIEFVAADIPTLLQQVHGREVQTSQGTLRLQTAGMEVRHMAVDWRTRALLVLANPNLALVLLMIGVYGLLFEFMSPGALVPGVAGAIALVLALYALSALPLNQAGLALLLLGVGLLVAEAFAPSFGILGLGGVLALVLGAGMLVDEHDGTVLAPSLPLVAGMGLASLAASMLVLRLAWRNRHLRSHSGTEGLIGQPARVLDWSDASADGHVLLAGERWRATGDATLQPGQQVWVVAVQGLRAQVSTQPMAGSSPPPSSTPL